MFPSVQIDSICIVPQVISAGMQTGDMAHALAQMQQAAAVAARYQLSTWPLHMHLLEALLTTSASLQEADEALQVKHKSVMGSTCFLFCQCSYKILGRVVMNALIYVSEVGVGGC